MLHPLPAREAAALLKSLFSFFSIYFFLTRIIALNSRETLVFMASATAAPGALVRRIVCTGSGVNVADRDVTVGAAKGTFDRVVPLGPQCADELYEAEVHRLVERVHDGVSGCVVLVGGTESQRDAAVQGLDGGGRGGAGLVERALRGLFDGSERSRDSGAETTIAMSFIELFDEVITDLLQLEAEEIPRGAGARAVRGVKRMRHAELGVEEGIFDDLGPTVSNTALVFADADDAIEAYLKGLKRQHSSATADGSAADRATRVVTIEMRRAAMSGGDRYGDDDESAAQISKLVLVEPPASDFLRAVGKSSPSRGDALASIANGRPSRLARHIATVVAAAREGSQYPPYHISSFTHLLAEAVGGNCETLVVGFLGMVDGGHGETAAIETLKLVDSFKGIVSFPVPMRGAILGLLRRNRRQSKMLRDKLALSRGAHTAEADAALTRLKSEAGEEKASLEKKLMEQSQELATQTKLAADNWEKCEKIEASYRELVKRKDEVAVEHIAAEEQRLQVSRALIDLRQEMTRQNEEADELEYRLVSKQLALENTIVELEGHEQEVLKHVADMEVCRICAASASLSPSSQLRAHPPSLLVTLLTRRALHRRRRSRTRRALS